MNGSPKPESEADEDRSYFITRLFTHEKFVGNSDKEPKKGTEGNQAMLVILVENSMVPQIQFMEEMNLTRKQVQKDMNELQKESVLVR